MAQSAVSQVATRLAGLLSQEFWLLYGVRDEVEWMERELRRIKCFLKDADAKGKRDERVKNWVNDVIQVAYLAEDAIDTFLLKVGQSHGWLSRIKYWFKPSTLVARHNVGVEIGKIKERLNEIKASREAYGIQNLSEDGDASNLISIRIWILQDYSGNDLYTQSVIAATIWFIWKARCNLIFRNEALDCHAVVSKAIGHIREYSYQNKPHLRKFSIGDNFSLSDSPILMYEAVYNQDGRRAGLGYVLLDNYSNFICAGCCGVPSDSKLDADIRALWFALQCIYQDNLIIKTVLSTSGDLVKTLNQGSVLEAWRMNERIFSIRELLGKLGNPSLMIIPVCWNRIASSLALHGLNHHEISRFHQGRELPKFIMKSLRLMGSIV